MPSFKVLKSGSVVLDSAKRGRLVIEWTARSAGGTLQSLVKIFVPIVWSQREKEDEMLPFISQYIVCEFDLKLT